jgi:ribonucleoside-diphosphate reductase alpha chain
VVKRQAISDEVWAQNYQSPDDGSVEDTWERQAKACSSVEDSSIREDIYKDFKWLLSDFRASAGGRITANLGVPGREATTLYNCFVINPKDIPFSDSDSIEGIYTMLKDQAQTLKSEGGYGMNFSWIRPNGSYVKGIDSRTPGVLNFMELWDTSSKIITMGSEKILGGRKKNEKKKIRKGAMMGVLDCWHPEIEDFIEAKLVEGRLSKFNISVGVTEGFMEAVLNDDDWQLKFPDTEHPEYDKKWFGNIYDWEDKGLPVIVHKTIKAKDLWKKITKSTYTRNDPGVLFLDIINKRNPLYYAERVETTNPCGEIAMSTGVCLLLSLNLVKYIKKVDGKFVFDFETFKKAVKIATRFADNINDVSRVPLESYAKAIKEKRRLGIGVLALGSLHYCLGIRLGSEESDELIREIFKTKAEVEILTSAELGKEKGSFELFDRDKYFNSHWWNTLPISDDVKRRVEEIGCMRNSHRSANAPTGNMSLYVGVVSGGIEPIFMKEYARWSIVPEFERKEIREEGLNFPNVFIGEWFETEHLKASKAGTDDVLLGSFNGIDYQVDKNRGLTKRTVVRDWGWDFVQENYSQEEIQEMTDKGIFCTTEDLSVDDHIKMLQIISPFVDQNSSKTVNVPSDYPYDKFEEVYLKAWKSGIKGITTYRAGTMTAVLESVDAKKDENHVGIASAPKRPKELPCELHRPKINGREWAVVVGIYNGDPYEVFAGPISDKDFPSKGFGSLIKKKRGVYSLNMPNMQIDNIVDYFDDDDSAWATRMISMSMRHGIPLKFIHEQLSKDGFVTDVNKVLARILKKYVVLNEKPKCPKCESESVVFEEGCMRCLDCGFGKCG